MTCPYCKNTFLIHQKFMWQFFNRIIRKLQKGKLVQHLPTSNRYDGLIELQKEETDLVLINFQVCCHWLNLWLLWRFLHRVNGLDIDCPSWPGVLLSTPLWLSVFPSYPLWVWNYSQPFSQPFGIHDAQGSQQR